MAETLLTLTLYSSPVTVHLPLLYAANPAKVNPRGVLHFLFTRDELNEHCLAFFSLFLTTETLNLHRLVDFFDIELFLQHDLLI